MDKFSVISNKRTVEVFCSREGKYVTNCKFVSGIYGEPSREEVLYNLVIDIAGIRRAKDIFLNIMSQYSGEIIIDYDNMRYKVELVDGNPKICRIDTIREMFIKSGVKVIDDKELLEISTQASLVAKGGFEKSRDSNVIVASSGIRIMKKGAFWYPIRECFNDYSVIKDTLEQVTSRRTASLILKRLLEEIKQENTVILQVGPKLYELVFENDGIKFNETNLNFDREKEILSEYMNSEDVSFLINFPPRWIPKGFEYSHGTVDTGYVIKNKNEDYFIYIPEANMYATYDISQDESGFHRSCKNGKELACDLSDASKGKVDFGKYINQNQTIGVEKYCTGVFSDYSVVAGIINKLLKLGYKRDEINYFDFFKSGNYLSTSEILDPHPDPLDKYYGGPYTNTKVSSYSSFIIDDEKCVEEKYEYRGEKLKYKLSLEEEHIPFIPPLKEARIREEERKEKEAEAEAQRLRDELEKELRVKSKLGLLRSRAEDDDELGLDFNLVLS